MNTKGVEETDRKVARDKFMLEATDRASKDFAAQWTKGVEDGMSDEQAVRQVWSDAEEKYGVIWSDTSSRRSKGGTLGTNWADARTKLLKPAAIRSATPEELTAQRESYGKNYKPGPRQAVPFMPPTSPELHLGVADREGFDRGYRGGKVAAVEYLENGGHYDLAQMMRRYLLPVSPSAPVESPEELPPAPKGYVLSNGTIGSISDHVTLYQNPDCPYHLSDTPFRLRAVPVEERTPMHQLLSSVSKGAPVAADRWAEQRCSCGLAFEFEGEGALARSREMFEAHKTCPARTVPEERTAEMEQLLYEFREHIAAEVRKHHDESPQEIAGFILTIKPDHIEGKAK